MLCKLIRIAFIERCDGRIAGLIREPAFTLPLPADLFCRWWIEEIRVARAIAALIKHGLVEEAPVTEPNLSFGEEDQTLTGLFITDAGRAAIGGENLAASAGRDPTELTCEAEVTAPTRAPTKAALVLGLLNRSEGATLDDLVAATGWLPHTTRAHLTGLRKKGRTITRSKRGSATRYTIAAEG